MEESKKDQKKKNSVKSMIKRRRLRKEQDMQSEDKEDPDIA